MSMSAGSNLEKVFKAGHKAVTCECGSASGGRRRAFPEKGRYLKGYADAVNVTDNQTAVVRFCSMAASKILLEMGMEPVMQMVTRDMNRIGLQSNVLGAAALGIKISCASPAITSPSGITPSPRMSLTWIPPSC